MSETTLVEDIINLFKKKPSEAIREGEIKEFGEHHSSPNPEPTYTEGLGVIEYKAGEERQQAKESQSGEAQRDFWERTERKETARVEYGAKGQTGIGEPKHVVFVDGKPIAFEHERLPLWKAKK